MTLSNASQLPKVYYCRHMQPGTVGYDKEIILLDTDAIKAMAPSGVSIPVYVNHIEGSVDLKTLKEKADGYVTESFYNELDGWAWFKFIVVDDRGHEAIKKGWSVSNAHLPTKWGAGGTKNNVAYKREVIDSEYEHLAIVPDPRYENACIMTPEEFKNYQDENRKKLDSLKNSKGNKPMLKFFKNTRQEVPASEVDADTLVELKNGKSVSVQSLIDNFVEQDKEPEFVMVKGKKVLLETLVNAMEKKNKKPKKNEEMEKDEDEVDAEGDEDSEGDDEIGTDKKNKKNKMKKNKAKKNADDEDDENCENDMEGDEEDDVEEANAKKKNKMKKNAVGDEFEVDEKYFHQLKNAHMTAPKRTEDRVVTSIDGIARGKQRYGSATK